MKQISHSIKKFLAQETAGGIVMIICALLAFIWANSSFAESYHAVQHLTLQGAIGNINIHLTLSHFVQDVLMILFFLVVGLELKKEFFEGSLSDNKKRVLPFIAALAGAVVPAVLYTAIVWKSPELHQGWAIPTATDIAFSLTVLLLCGKNFIPLEGKIFLLAVAIYDDLMAIIVIALFYSASLNLGYLALSGVCAGALWILNKRNITWFLPYLFLGMTLAFMLHSAGIHATIAGVVTAFAYPLRDKTVPSVSPSQEILHKLHPFVAFGILPLFAFVSSGVALNLPVLQISLTSALFWGITVGLFIGKQLGISGIIFVLDYFNIFKKPQGLSWKHIYVLSVLAGIGFTMSLFIGNLAFKDPVLQDEVKLAVIAGSLLSSIWAMIMMRLWREKK